MTEPRDQPKLTVAQLTLAALPLLASVVFALFHDRLSLDVALSFAVLGTAVSVHFLHAIRGRSNSAADASVFAFGLMFLLVAPIVQLLVLGFKLVNTTHAVPDLMIQTNLACSLFIAGYLLARISVLRPPPPRPVQPVASAPPANLFALSLLVGLGVLITLFSIPFIGVTATDQGLAPVVLAFRKFVFFIPTALFLIALAEFRRSGPRRDFIHVLLLLLLFACVLVTQNPGTEKRNALGPVYLAVAYLLFRPWLQRRGVQVAWLLGVLLVLFPFASLFTYSPSMRDLGNARDRAEFIDHYGFIIREMLRATMPGRVACVHVQQLTTTKVTHGYTGLTDFRGDVIKAYIDGGWIFHGEVTVNKDPQAQAIRTKAQALMFVTKNRDSAMTRPALADYLLLFRKPGDNAVPIKNDVTNDEWIDWAQPVWWNIRETRTLNVRPGRDDADERHICPLQLDFIERCVRLWSNPGETVLSPFAGIGSEVYTAVKLGRRGVGCELKPSYWQTAVDNLRNLDREMSMPSLLDLMEA